MDVNEHEIVHLGHDMRLVGWFMVCNATVSIISVLSGGHLYWRRKLEKTTGLSQVTDKLNHIMLYRVHLAWTRFELTPLVVIATDCIGSYKPCYYTITTTAAPK